MFFIHFEICDSPVVLTFNAHRVIILTSYNFLGVEIMHNYILFSAGERLKVQEHLDTK